ncbi:hypothetical protein [Myxosarcina sp. GI1(2024)]
MTTILLLEEDDETRPILVKNLRNEGYKVIVVVDRENAIDWMSSANLRPEIFIINQVNISLSQCLKNVQHIYQKSKFSQPPPVIILADKYPSELEGTVTKISRDRYVLYLEDAEQLFDFLHRLCFENNI